MKDHLWTSLTLPCFLIRFALITPTVYYWGYAKEHYKLVNSNVQLHNGTYGTDILPGEKLAAKWGFILFMYNLVIWLPSIICIPPLNLLLTIVDTALTVFLSITTHYQTGYVPHNLEACHDPDGLELQRPPGTNESFFAAAGRLNGTVTTPTRMCVDFVKEWQYGVALSFLYALISFFGFFAFFGAFRQAKKENTSILDQVKETLSFIWGGLFCLVKWPVVVTWFIMYYTLVFIFRCLPLDVKAPVRSGRRYAVKTVLGAEQKTEIMLSELKNVLTKREDVVGLYQSSGGTHTELAQFLGVYDMLVMVTKHLHYVDLVSLSTVSKSVREAVLPSNDISRRLTMFRQYTCDCHEKTTCWCCMNQICGSCQEDYPLPQTIAFYHVDNCVPYCASCYHTHIVRHPRVRIDRLKGNSPCIHAPRPTRQRNFLWRFRNRGAYYTNPLGFPPTDRQVCRSCNQLPAEELALRNARDAVTMLKKGLKSNGEKWKTCANSGCDRGLGTGPRFWICQLYTCRKECTSAVHQAWGSKADDGVDGDALV